MKIAASIAETLGQLHLKDIIHRNIKPHNILLNATDGRLKISDFGISAVLTRENHEINNPDVIQGTLLYISPEQTGRMNRNVDYRTDLYSLGVTLYELITNTVPFASGDPLEIIYSHIARPPLAPWDRNRDIPKMVSDIIMKLLAKNAEERYQNGFGLMADLKQTLRYVEAGTKIEPFRLARYDISNRFIIPQRLYGREKELDLLLTAFDRMNSDKSQDGKGAGALELLLVTGDSGIGKSALINEVRKPITARRGYFLSGKHEQFGQDKPYSAIV